MIQPVRTQDVYCRKRGFSSHSL